SREGGGREAPIHECGVQSQPNQWERVAIRQCQSQAQGRGHIDLALRFLAPLRLCVKKLWTELRGSAATHDGGWSSRWNLNCRLPRAKTPRCCGCRLKRVSKPVSPAA